jgi:hypothetical protein
LDSMIIDELWVGKDLEGCSQAWLRECPVIYMAGLKTTSKYLRIAGVWVEIQAEHVLCMSLERYLWT